MERPRPAPSEPQTDGGTRTCTCTDQLEACLDEDYSPKDHGSCGGR